MTNEYANADACRAAGVEPVPEVGDAYAHIETPDVIQSVSDAGRLYLMGAASEWFHLIRRGDTVIERGGE